MPSPTWVSQGACSHLGAYFEENARKKLRRHMSEIYGKAKQAMTNLGIEEALIMENSYRY